MKSLRVASVLVLWPLSFTIAHPASAQGAGPAASGSYRFLLEDDLLKSADFDVSTDANANTTGRMSFTDQARIPDVDDPEDPRQGDPPSQFYVSVNFDGLNVERNQALMSGTVLDSSHGTYIGKWVQLVAEDNGGGQSVPDKLTWAFCKPQPGGWIPSDAELSYDDGAYLSWWATDAERQDDVGILSKNLIPGQETGCQVHRLLVYSFVDPLRWEGRIVVQP